MPLFILLILAKAEKGKTINTTNSEISVRSKTISGQSLYLQNTS